MGYKPAKRTLYKIECTSGFCDVEETFIVRAESEEAAEEFALELWNETICPSANCEGEINEEEAEDYGEVYDA